MKLAINGATTMPYSLEKDIIAAEKAGFEGVEIWWDKIKNYLQQASLSEMAEILREHNVQPIGICPFLVSPFRNTSELRAEFEHALEVAEQIQCKLIIICPDYRPAELSVNEGMEKHGKEFAWYAQKAKERGIKLAIEPIGGHTLVPGPKEALELIRLAGEPDNLGIVFDTFHYMRSGVKDADILAIPPEKFYIVHVNDSESGMAEELQDKNRLYPFEGCINLERYKKLLHEIGYDGYYSVEVFRPEYWEQNIDDISNRAFLSGKKLTDKEE